MPRKLDISLLLILLIALILRLIMLGERNLWYDEAFAVLFAEKGLDAMLYGTLTPVAGGAADIHPLLYYTLLNVWMNIFGQSVFAIRLLSVAFGLFTVVVVYFLAQDLFDRRVGVAAALITAIAPFHIQYSQEARMYSLMALLLVLATWALVRSLKSDKIAWRWWFMFGVCCALSMYTQQLSAFYLAALGVVPFLTRKRSAIFGLIFGVAVALIVYAPWLVFIPSQLNKVESYYWIPIPNVARTLLTLRSFFSANLDMPPPAGIITLIVSLILFIFLCIQLIAGVQRIKANRFGIKLAMWMFAAPIALMWIFSQFRPVYLDRGLIGSALMLYVALAWMSAKSGLPRVITVMLATLGIFAAAFGLQAHYTWATFPNSPFRQMTEFIRTNSQQGDVIVHQDKISALPSIFYGRDLTQRYLRDEPQSADDTLALPTQQSLGLLADSCIQAAASGAERVWFVLFTFTEAQYNAAGVDDVSQQLGWLNDHFSQTDETTFNDLRVILFENGNPSRDTECLT
jgi:uncharacterized membrane protein